MAGRVDMRNVPVFYIRSDIVLRGWCDLSERNINILLKQQVRGQQRGSVTKFEDGFFSLGHGTSRCGDESLGILEFFIMIE